MIDVSNELVASLAGYCYLGGRRNVGGNIEYLDCFGMDFQVLIWDG